MNFERDYLLEYKRRGTGRMNLGPEPSSGQHIRSPIVKGDNETDIVERWGKTWEALTNGN